MNPSLITNLLRALLKWWWLIAVAVSVAIGVGYLIRNQQPDMYSAVATIAVGGTDSPIPSVLHYEIVDGILVFVQRNSTLQPVIDDLQLGISVDEFRSRLSFEAQTVRPDANSTFLSPFMNVGIVDTDPERAAVIVNRLAREIVNQSVDRSTLLDVEFIDEQVQDLQQQITQLQNEHNQLVEESATLTSAYDIQINLQERNEIQTTIQGLQTLLLQLVSNVPENAIYIEELAEPNYFPIASNIVLDLAIAGLAGGGLAIATILLFAFFDDRLQWVEGAFDEIEGVRVLGPLGIVNKNNLPLFVDSAPQSVEAEAIRQIRSKLTLISGGTPPQVITITSYDSGEGKTLTSVNMALQMARSGMRTLVIDGDMRRGDLHENFNVPNVFGLSGLLGSDEPIEKLLLQVMVDSGYENLTLLPSGRAPADPAALLERPRFRKLIQLFRSQFDAIVLDGVPLLGGPDAIFLAKVSDGVMIIVNNRRTRLSSLRRTLEDLRNGPPINIFGLAFNRVHLQVTTKYNNKYYRQTPLMNAERFSRELSRPSTSRLPLRANITLDAKGQRLFSIKACATHLGVKKSIVRDWLRTGYLQSERRAFRRWIPESSINDLLASQRASVSFSLPVTEDHFDENPEPAAHVNGSQQLPDQLREQRQALLDFVGQRDTPETES